MRKTRLSAIAVAILVTCFVAGAAYSSGSLPAINGDVDCSGAVDPVDSLKLLRYDAGLSYSQGSNCAPIGESGTGGTSPTPAPGGAGLSRDNPVPQGQSYLVPEGWELTVVDFTANATQEVLDENQFNDPPAPGKRFSIVRIRTKNVSAGNPADHDVGFALRMVGSQNIGYSTFEASCGVIPDDIDFKPDDLFEGGSLEGNICYETANGETDFTIYTNYFLSDDENVRWFEVK